MSPLSYLSLLARVRWGNVGLAVLVAAVAGLVVAWPHLRSADPPLPPPAPRAVVVRATAQTTPMSVPSTAPAEFGVEAAAPVVRRVKRTPAKPRKRKRKRVKHRHHPHPARHPTAQPEPVAPRPAPVPLPPQPSPAPIPVAVRPVVVHPPAPVRRAHPTASVSAEFGHPRPRRRGEFG